MPTLSPEKIRQRTATLRKKLAEKRDSMDAVAVRRAGKRIRRLQRKRRKVEAGAARKAGAGKKTKEA